MFFVYNLSIYSPKNKACKELNYFIVQFNNILIKDECSLHALRCSIETKINEINSAHPKLRPIRYSWSESLMRIDASIKAGSGCPDYLFAMDICRVRSVFQFSEANSQANAIATPDICRVCGCTENDPCFHPDHGTCWWDDEEHTICSHCADPHIADDPGTEHCINSKGGHHEK